MIRIKIERISLTKYIGKYKKINEKYTSKMCCVCGNVKEDLGGKKIYKCENCKQQIDRDVGGAIGIGIKAIQ